jgi:hypothetical protein
VAEVVPQVIHFSLILFFCGIIDIVLHIDKTIFITTLVFIRNLRSLTSMETLQGQAFVPTKPWSISTIYGGSGEVGKDSTASDNEITVEIKQNSLRPGRILAPFPVRYNLKGTSIEDPCHLGQ